jgi:hypothetical protein
MHRWSAASTVDLHVEGPVEGAWSSEAGPLGRSLRQLVDIVTDPLRAGSGCGACRRRSTPPPTLSGKLVLICR